MMKLEDVKYKIDAYIDSVTEEELIRDLNKFGIEVTEVTEE